MTAVVKVVTVQTVRKMFTILPITLTREPSCTKTVKGLTAEDFRYYDKDGFELNQAEQKYYRAMGYPIDYPILNHVCWQEPWIELNDPEGQLILDHSMFLCRANYAGKAAEQLTKLQIPQANYLLQTKQKWGFDFALDAVSDDGTAYEVIHIEYDNYDYNTFTERMYNFEQLILKTDWRKAARVIWNTRDQWTNLTGFEQNHWKANYLLGWQKSEYTEKSV